MSEDGVQDTHEFSHASAAVWCVGQTAADCGEGRGRAMACPLDVLSPDTAVVAGVYLECARRMLPIK